MTQLVQKSDLDQYKYIADSVKNSVVWPQFVSDAQQFDIKTWLGDALLNELITQAETSPTSFSTANQTLLNGGSYVYQDEIYLFQGLKACIIYFAFSNFTSKSPFNYTAFGLTTKTSDLSTPVSDKTVQRLKTEEYLKGCAIRDEIILFLRRNSADYPLFKCCNKSIRPRTFYVMGE